MSIVGGNRVFKLFPGHGSRLCSAVVCQLGWIVRYRIVQLPEIAASVIDAFAPLEVVGRNAKFVSAPEGFDGCSRSKPCSEAQFKAVSRGIENISACVKAGVSQIVGTGFVVFEVGTALSILNWPLRE